MGPEPALIDAYAVLGVAPTAGQDELKAAHRRLVRRYHPDLAGPDERAAATRRVQEINVAYGLVRDAERRQAYDRLRRRYRIQAAAAVDADLARHWESLLGAAGRWAGRWWSRNRRTLARSAGKAAHGASRLGRAVVGRVLQVAYAATGLVVGMTVALAASRLLVGELGVFSPIAGLAAGLLVGADRGSRRRSRVTELPPPPRPAVVAPLIGMLLVAAALAADRFY